LLLYVLTLLAESRGLPSPAIFFSHAVFVERGSLKKRLFSFAPYLGVTVVWRVLYNLSGYGAHGSGIYIDPVREPLHFARAFVERAPILCLGQFLLPPAELSAAMAHVSVWRCGLSPFSSWGRWPLPFGQFFAGIGPRASGRAASFSRSSRRA